MELAAILAAGLRDWIDFGVIIGILMLNATVGWYQEKQAADVVASLKGDIAMKAMTVRNGQEEEILAREIVPGDIVRMPRYAMSTIHWPEQIILEEGCTVPGEARLICAYDDPDGFEKYKEHQNSFSDESPAKKEEEEDVDSTHEKEAESGHSLVSIDQSAMTGESLAVRTLNIISSLLSTDRLTPGRKVHGRSLLLYNGVQAR